MRAIVFLLIAMLVTAVPGVHAQTTGAKAVVVLDEDAGELHSGIDVSAAYASAMEASRQVVANQFGAPSSMSGVVGGAVGGAIGGAIVGAMIASGQQKQADAAIAPLTSLVSEDQVMASVQAGIRAALLAEGFDRVDFVLARSPGPKLLDRLDAGRDLQRVLFIDKDAKEGWSNSLVTLTRDNRSLRVAMRIHDFRRDDRGLDKVATRRINLFSQPTEAAKPNVALADRVALGADALRAEIESGVDRALRLSRTADTAPKAADDSVVRFINRAGAFEVPGDLLAHEDGVIRVIDHKGNLAVYAADLLL